MSLKQLLGAMSVAAFATTANASFHTFDINEIFSNADGSIQFIELQEKAGLANQHLFGAGTRGMEMDDGTPSVFLFGADLPNNQTANKFVLLATTGFAALAGAPTPDYIIPDNFLTISGGTLGFGSGVNGNYVTDTLSFAALPTDGITSLFDGGGSGLNSPTNFAGATGSIDVSAVPIPASALLFGSAISVLLLRQRKLRA